MNQITSPYRLSSARIFLMVIIMVVAVTAPLVFGSDPGLPEVEKTVPELRPVYDNSPMTAEDEARLVDWDVNEEKILQHISNDVLTIKTTEMVVEEVSGENLWLTSGDGYRLQFPKESVDADFGENVTVYLLLVNE